MTTLNELAAEIHEVSVAHGWWEGVERNFPEVLMLMVSEVSEALEEYRSGHPIDEMYHNYSGSHPGVGVATGVSYGWKPEGVPTELADVIIRVLDACAAYGVDIDEAVRLKMAYNRNRPYRHGGKLA